MPGRGPCGERKKLGWLDVFKSPETLSSGESLMRAQLRRAARISGEASPVQRRRQATFTRRFVPIWRSSVRRTDGLLQRVSLPRRYRYRAPQK